MTHNCRLFISSQTYYFWFLLLYDSIVGGAVPFLVHFFVLPAEDGSESKLSPVHTIQRRRPFIDLLFYTQLVIRNCMNRKSAMFTESTINTVTVQHLVFKTHKHINSFSRFYLKA